MPEVTVRGKDGGTAVYYDYKGLLLSNLSNLEDRIESMKAMKASPDDILICSYPKSGLHWIFEIIGMLVRNETTPSPDVVQDRILEFYTPELEKHDRSPRVFNSHLYYDMLPNSFKENKCKIVYISRDPRAVVSSYWHFLRHKGFNITLNWSEFVDCFYNGQVINNSWMDHIKTWDKAMQENVDQPFFVVNYEDAKEDPLKIVKELNEYLGTARSDDMCSQVAESTRFDKLKEAKLNKTYSHSVWGFLYDSKTVSPYRKGIVDSWKQDMTVAQEEEFRHRYGEMSKNIRIPIKSLAQ